MPIINRRLREARESIGMSQTFAAQHIGLKDRIYLTQLEAGAKENPSSRIRARLAKLYGKTPGDLFDEWMMELEQRVEA